MDIALPFFKIISMIFASSAVITGIVAIVAPVGFSKVFGLPLETTPLNDTGPFSKHRDTDDQNGLITDSPPYRSLAMSYVSLMGVRQLATGLILLTFACQHKWAEVATVLAIIGILVACTDGIYLARVNGKRSGQLHAIPGVVIAALAGVVIYYNP